MNYLCHLFLSQHTPMSFTGNLMGDFDREKDMQTNLPTTILDGIRNHKFVDNTTDHYAAVKSLKPLFSTERRRFAGVVIDVSFDYFLIKHWQTLSDIDLASFINSSYVGLEACTKWMPLRMQMVCRKMHEYDWLSQYGQLTGIATSIDMISNRIRFKNNMAGSIVEVERNYDAIEAVFLDLIVYLQEEVKRAAFEKG